VNEILNFIRKECKKVDHLRGTDEAILIAGSTGNGKSTLLNYLKGEKLYINEDRKLYCSNSKIKIGDGSGSTTLLPNFVQTSLGNFLDLAGDF
jgi:energy-coupling factor transporter ATP-binding protein EcfA2